ncbi:MAG: cytochrome c-type biogenesis protein [Solirubrobacteraceae bacterium]
MRALALLALALLALAPGGAPAAQPRASFNDVEDEVMCDTCNVPLNIADSPRADQERAQIRRYIGQGLTKQQIKSRLKAEYGPGILATPQDSGFSLTVWIVPVLLALAVIAALAVALPRWRRGERGSEAAPVLVGPALSDADARRLDEDLARYDR